jgi:EAL domain-containing protein (putative c-di-GMP-specific phosphodiesterase class I)
MSETIRPSRSSEPFSWASGGIGLERELARAVERGELVAYYQPQWDVWSEKMVAVEALCRWRHPQIGVIAPSVFISLAEESGVIHGLGDFMIDTACDLAADLQAHGSEIDVSLNMSAVQLETPAACARVLERVLTRSIDPSRITVEVTESVHIDDVAKTAAHLLTLREAGVGVSIDDFGTGHSSTAQVLELPVTEIKADRSLINRPVDEARVLMAEVVSLARHRSLRVVAEGIETREQLELVREEGCDRAQGFLLGRPKPREVLERTLALSS